MTATVLDLGEAEPDPDAVATLLGSDGGATVALAEWGALEGTDPYDLTTRLGRLLPRRLVGASR